MGTIISHVSNPRPLSPHVIPIRRGSSRFTAVSTQNAVYGIIFHMDNCKPTFALSCTGFRGLVGRLGNLGCCAQLRPLSPPLLIHHQIEQRCTKRGPENKLGYVASCPCNVIKTLPPPDDQAQFPQPGWRPLSLSTGLSARRAEVTGQQLSLTLNGGSGVRRTSASPVSLQAVTAQYLTVLSKPPTSKLWKLTKVKDIHSRDTTAPGPAVVGSVPLPAACPQDGAVVLPLLEAADLIWGSREKLFRGFVKSNCHLSSTQSREANILVAWGYNIDLGKQQMSQSF